MEKIKSNKKKWGKCRNCKLMKPLRKTGLCKTCEAERREAIKTIGIYNINYNYVLGITTYKGDK